MKQDLQEKEMKAMMEAPVSGKRVGIIRLQMVREGRTLYGMGTFDKPEKAVEMVWPLIAMSDREMMLVMSLDTNLEPLAAEIAAVGGINSCCIDVKNIFKGAILSNAACVICFHNHPSGNPKPSREDFMITQRMKMAGEILGVTLADHIIVGKDGFYSFKEHGYLEPEPSGGAA